ncbi:MAG: DUF6702 family protein [Bacteroidota bacterium]
MKLKFGLSVLLILLILPTLGFIHPFYFSLTQIDHNPQTNSLEITVKLFTGDIELALEAQGTGRMFLGEAQKEHIKADLYLERYLKQHFQLNVNGEAVQYEYLGKEVELDVVWCYVEVANVADVRKLVIKNSLLVEEFEDQQNVVQVKIGKQKKSALLGKGAIEESLSFE